jgi:limonene-1,2-epoxide hydrolase
MANRSAQDVVLDFVDAWNALDWPRIYGLMAEDIFYHNIPFPPCEGRAAAQAFLQSWPVEKAEWRVHHIAADGPVVLTERTDTFIKDGAEIVVRVMGAFEVEGGRIKSWRDYFDRGALKPKAG